MATLTRYEALVQVYEAFGSQQAMAEGLGVTQPTIWRWLNQSRQMPAEFVLKAEAATGVSRHHLRPDIYPVEPVRGPAGFHGVDRGQGRVNFNRGSRTKAVA